ncbi:DUF5008 domain-containing protein [Pedobacter gandavensis]|uniref:DUF5008 domain-containing protein n=1 Tax=Pedobacter gandavensis TaxID=2679963 RepID=UPI0029311B22|nr:DUF5008 domain-containing protein [Pedobacter gandavensis]
MLTNIKYKPLIALVLLCTILTASCKKQQGIVDDPYAGGKKIAPFAFISKNTNPDIVVAGTVLNLKVRGLESLKGDFKLYVNEVEAELKNYTDTTIQFSIPLTASTGSVWITSKGESFFGPIIKVGGKVSVDANFKIINGAAALPGEGAAAVFDIEKLPSGRFWLGGSFSNFEQKGTAALPIGGIVQIDANGAYLTTDINFGKAALGAAKTIYSISRISEGNQAGKFIIAGSFNGYNINRANRLTLNNIARLNANGRLDTIVTKEIINPKPQEISKNADTVPAFNAGVDGPVRKAFIFGEQIYIVGNFQNFVRVYYPNSTYDEKVYDVTRMMQLVRVNEDGSMDSTFHYNKAIRQSAAGANGVILDAAMQTDGKLILAGSFTSFNGVTVNRIVRLNLDGSVDPSFKSGVGADGDIHSIRYNASTNKFTLSGNFSRFNGKPSSGVVLLNADGSNVDSFIGEQISGGMATFAAQLNNGKIIVAGSFNRYGNYLRQGFMILDTNGKLAVGYNNTGGFQGRIYDMVETVVGNDSQVILVGEINRFNSMLPKNVLRLIISN